ncbi:MAG: hypothetical protein V7K24_05415 [Nostoc sp.]
MGFLLDIAKGKTANYLMFSWKPIMTIEKLSHIILHQRAIVCLFTKRVGVARRRHRHTQIHLIKQFTLQS